MRLRYEVFNLELGEGLEQSHASGRDEDTFDAGCHHLIVEHEPTGQIIGTYRMQTQEMAEANGGFYSDGEFDLSGFPHAVLKQSVELGRACVAQEHRRQRVLFGLWKGLAAYVTFMNKRYLFGCCSLTSQDPQQGRMVLEKLRLDGLIHPDYIVKPRPDMLCEDSNSPIADPSSVKLPTFVRHLPALRRLGLQPACHRPRVQDHRLSGSHGLGHTARPNSGDFFGD